MPGSRPLTRVLSTDYVNLSGGLAAYPYVTDLCITGYLGRSYFKSAPEISEAWLYATRDATAPSQLTTYINSVTLSNVGDNVSSLPGTLAAFQGYGPGTQTNNKPGMLAYYQSTISKTFGLVQYEGSYVQIVRHWRPDLDC